MTLTLRFWIVNSRRRACEAVVQPVEAYGGNGGKQIELLRKMIIGRAVAHPGAARHFPQRERPILFLGDQLQRRLDQRVAQITMVVRPGFTSAIFFRHDPPRC